MHSRFDVKNTRAALRKKNHQTAAFRAFPASVPFDPIDRIQREGCVVRALCAALLRDMFAVEFTTLSSHSARSAGRSVAISHPNLIAASAQLLSLNAHPLPCHRVAES